MCRQRLRGTEASWLLLLNELTFVTGEDRSHDGRSMLDSGDP
jgi:hypothetical protein